MSASLIETLIEGERGVNRSCAIVSLWIAAVCAVLCLLGLTGALWISPKWMYFYFCADVLPLLAVAGYARLRKYRGSEIRFLMVLAAALVPAALSVPSLFGFFLMPLPIAVAGRYFSRRFVWETFLMTVALAFVMTVPHAKYGIPCYPLCDEAREVLGRYLAGEYDSRRYWRYLVVHCLPSLAFGLGFFAIVVSRLCNDHLKMLANQAKTDARLADVEKGLAIAATMEFVREQGTGNGEQVDGARVARHEAPSTRQPEVSGWSTTQIIKCISRCKKRAAEDPAFAALVERDPAAAVREVQK